MKKNNIELIIGTGILIFIILIGLISLFYTPHDPNQMDIVNKLQGPSTTYLLGTDQFGRDVLSRLMVGTKLVFIIGLSTVGISLFVGGILGAFAGFYGGILDEVLMKIIEAQMAFPGVLLALMLISIFPSDTKIIILALAIMNIPRFTRVTRSEFMKYRNADFVVAARALGISDLKIMVRHILPNITSPIIVTCAISFATAILSEAGLSYLGLGTPPPHASWGKMLNEAQPYMMQTPLLAIAPGVMITLVVLGFNLIADGLRKNSRI